MTTPDQIVSEQIIHHFKKKGVLQEASLQGLAEKLAAGKLGASDWQLLFKLDATNEDSHGTAETKTN